MKQKIIYTLLVAILSWGAMEAQLSCNTFIDVDLDENGEGIVQASDLIPDVEFFIANGTLTYFIFPYNSGIFESGSDVIQLNCNNVGTYQYIVEYTVDGELVSACWATINVFDPFDSCPSNTYCDDNGIGCDVAIAGFSMYSFPSITIPAEQFAVCSSSTGCNGEYQVAVGTVANATQLDFSESLDGSGIEDYKTPIVLSYTVNGGTQFDQSYLYIWSNLECNIIPVSNKTLEMDLTAEITITPEIFLHPDNTCTDITMAITEVNGSAPTEYFSSITLDCDDLGYHTVYLRDAATGFVVTSQFFLSDPLETCGPILGPGDKLIKMFNNPPLGTFANTTITVNGNVLPVSLAGKGWIINESLLAEGINTLDFDTGPFSVNGISTLDIVKLLKLIIMDEYDEPIQSLVMDVDNSGYNGLGDLILLRRMILAIPFDEEVSNTLFVPTEFEFPDDFNPFDFDYDFTKYEFDKADFEDLSFLFESYKVGDFTGNAVTEDNLKNEDEISTRALDAFEVTDMDVEAGVPFNFSLVYDAGVPIKGLLAALVSNGVTFQALTSQIDATEVQHNIINDTEIRISYVSSDPTESVERVSFEITAISNNSGPLIDLLGLKAGFPQEVINEDDEVIIIDNLEESVTTSVENIDLISELEVYPNPAAQKLNLSNDGVLGKVHIMDPMGRVVFMKNEASNEIQIDISEFKDGIYYLKVENDRQSINTSFIKI